LLDLTVTSLPGEDAQLLARWAVRLLFICSYKLHVLIDNLSMRYVRSLFVIVKIDLNHDDHSCNRHPTAIDFG